MSARPSRTDPPDCTRAGPERFRLDGKSVLISGAGGAFGRSAMRGFARAGATVFGIDVNAESLEETRRLVGRRWRNRGRGHRRRGRSRRRRPCLRRPRRGVRWHRRAHQQRRDQPAAGRARELPARRLATGGAGQPHVRSAHVAAGGSPDDRRRARRQHRQRQLDRGCSRTWARQHGLRRQQGRRRAADARAGGRVGAPRHPGQCDRALPVRQRRPAEPDRQPGQGAARRADDQRHPDRPDGRAR